jgi:DNA-binding transcriptional regulator GbsR (MarR family)
MPYNDPNKNKLSKKKYFEEHKDEYRARCQARRENARKHVADIKSKSSCQNCGENHPACLDFHHNDSKQKEHNISRLISHAASIKKIDAEIAKCQILCANCHRKVHYQK